MATKKIELTPAQTHALSVFSKMKAPTLKEWADRLGIRYNSVLHYRTILVEAGFMLSDPGKARSTVITRQGKSYLKGDSQ